MKKVGIIVPVYNTAKYLPQCLDSIINQSYKNIEILIVDDGSTDKKTIELISFYENKYANITSRRIENSGQAVARNVGIDFFASRDDVDYLEFVDSDDFLEPSCVEDAVNNIGECDLLWFDCSLIFEDENIKVNAFEENERGFYGFYEECVIVPQIWLEKSIEINKRSFAATWNCLIKKTFLYDINLKSLDLFAEDEHFGIMLFYQAKDIVVFPKKLYNYRIRKGSTVGYGGGNFKVKAVPKRLQPYLADFFDNPMLFMKYYRAGGAAIMFNEIYNSLKSSNNFELLKQTNFLKRHCMLALNLNSFLSDPLDYKKYLSKELLEFAKTYKIGAYALIHSTLAYQLGQVIISAKFGFKRFLKTPFYIYQMIKSAKFSKNSNPNIDYFWDKDYAQKLKKHKSFRIGKIFFKEKI